MLRNLTACVLMTLVYGVHAADRPEAYPTKSVRFVVPYAPGGGSDITARAIGQKLSE